MQGRLRISRSVREGAVRQDESRHAPPTTLTFVVASTRTTFLRDRYFSTSPHTGGPSFTLARPVNGVVARGLDRVSQISDARALRCGCPSACRCR
jgi:hypothetical protein